MVTSTVTSISFEREREEKKEEELEEEAGQEESKKEKALRFHGAQEKERRWTTTWKPHTEVVQKASKQKASSPLEIGDGDSELHSPPQREW